MRILITGGAGFIGSHIVDQYIAAGHEVAVVDNLWEEGGGKHSNIHPKANFYHADITDEAALATIFNEVQPEVVNHHAAQHSVAISGKNPQLDARINILGLLNILTNCTRVGTRKIIFASSGATYGTPDHLPIVTDMPQYPESPYGITKVASEHYLRFWHDNQQLTYTILRYGNVYGPRQDPNGEAGVIAIFAKKFLAHEQIRIDWDGKQQKDYVYVEDVARANLLALDKGNLDSFILATGKGTSVNTIYQTIAQAIGYKVPIMHAPKRPGDIYLSYFDYSKTERELGWQPQVQLEEGIQATVAFFRDVEPYRLDMQKDDVKMSAGKL
jgi:UDP-glucose 4-epimerase